MPKVIIYTTPTCPYCHLAKEFFQEHNVAFEEFNVAEDAVPVIDVDGEIIIGFDKAKLEKLLLKK